MRRQHAQLAVRAHHRHGDEADGAGRQRAALHRAEQEPGLGIDILDDAADAAAHHAARDPLVHAVAAARHFIAA